MVPDNSLIWHEFIAAQTEENEDIYNGDNSGVAIAIPIITANVADIKIVDKLFFIKSPVASKNSSALSVK